MSDEEETDYQIPQIISFGSRWSTNQNSIVIQFPFSKAMLQQLIYLLSSSNQKSYGDLKLESAGFVVANGNIEETFTKKSSLNELAYGLTKYYNHLYNKDIHWMRIRDNVEYSDKKEEKIIIILNFIDNGNFQTDVRTMLRNDLKKNTEIDVPENFDDYTDNVIGYDYYDANSISKRQEEFNKEQYIYDDISNQNNLEDQDINLTEKPKIKRKRKQYEKTRVLPIRVKRFTGKYGKGINFDLINSHCLRYHSFTGNIDIYNNLQNIKKEINRLRKNAARQIYIE